MENASISTSAYLPETNKILRVLALTIFARLTVSVYTKRAVDLFKNDIHYFNMNMVL